MTDVCRETANEYALTKDYSPRHDEITQNLLLILNPIHRILRIPAPPKDRITLKPKLSIGCIQDFASDMSVSRITQLAERWIRVIHFDFLEQHALA